MKLFHKGWYGMAWADDKRDLNVNEPQYQYKRIKKKDTYRGFGVVHCRAIGAPRLAWRYVWRTPTGGYNLSQEPL